MLSSAERSIEGKGLLSKTCSRLLRSTAAPSLRAWPRTATMVASAIQERAIFAISPFGPVVLKCCFENRVCPAMTSFFCNCPKDDTRLYPNFQDISTVRDWG